MSDVECQIECQIKCQTECQIICQINCQFAGITRRSHLHLPIAVLTILVWVDNNDKKPSELSKIKPHPNFPILTWSLKNEVPDNFLKGYGTFVIYIYIYMVSICFHIKYVIRSTFRVSPKVATWRFSNLSQESVQQLDPEAALCAIGLCGITRFVLRPLCFLAIVSRS